MLKNNGHETRAVPSVTQCGDVVVHQRSWPALSSRRDEYSLNDSVVWRSFAGGAAGAQPAHAAPDRHQPVSGTPALAGAHGPSSGLVCEAFGYQADLEPQ